MKANPGKCYTLSSDTSKNNNGNRIYDKKSIKIKIYSILTVFYLRIVYIFHAKKKKLNALSRVASVHLKTYFELPSNTSVTILTCQIYFPCVKLNNCMNGIRAF